MVKDGAGGLLGKVMRRVLVGSQPRSGPPVFIPSAEGESDSEYESGKGRQLLRELMERRRRNDLVRQREFDQLRRMRRLMVASSPTLADSGVDSEVGLSGFMDTAFDQNTEERAITLRKIDEIEEQMSRQWWKTRPAEPSDMPDSAGDSKAAAARLPEASASRHQILPPEVVFDFGPPAPPQPTNFAPTALQGDTAPAHPAPPAPVAGALGRLDLELDFDLVDSLVPDLELPDLELPDPALSQLVEGGPGPLAGPQPALPGFQHNPLLEEAAIEFANAELASVQSCLHALIDGAVSGAAQELTEDAVHELWLTLFDFYRAVGKHESFEASAIAYAERFGRSPPVWVSLAADVAPPPAGTGDFYWRCPALVGAHTVVRLRSGAAAAAGAWWLDWSGVEGFEYEAVALLLETFTGWSLLPVQIYFEGADRLLAALQARTLTGAADAEADWWRLRMETLRLLRRMDEYEEAALDYCITYEVSPPSWLPPACDCRALQIGSHQQALADPLSGHETGAVAAAEAASLSGEIGSDVATALARLDTAIALRIQAGTPSPDGLLVVDCTRLVRLDFTAAGSVLGWAANRHGEGLAVEFRNLHRLVGTFFNVTGICDYARVYVRSD